MRQIIAFAALLWLALSQAVAAQPAPLRTPAEIDSFVVRAMAEVGAKGLALAVIEDGQVTHVRSFGLRNAKGQPLERETVMYGASITKAVFAYTVMQLVEEGLLDLDAPISSYLSKPLPEYAEPEVEDRYARWSDLAGDGRWRKLTARHLLTHSPGFANFGFMEPDGKLRFHFEPGARYAYSGDGYILLQCVLERGLGLDLGREMQRRVFNRFGMANTSMIWRPDFARNLADGWNKDGAVEPHDERSAVRAAGSMDTTIEDMARFAAGYVRGEGLSRRGRAELVRPQLPITLATQFPTLQPELAPALRRADLASGLGVEVFDGPQGRAFVRGGHNDTTGNIWVCVERRRSCVVILSNDVRAEAAFPSVVRYILGETGAPWTFSTAISSSWNERGEVGCPTRRRRRAWE
jgi:CubicO group peptidase (beta-lactamase class C family)